MSDMKTTIRRMGNSQGVLLPKPVLEQVGLAVNDDAELTVEGGALVLRKPKAPDAELQDSLRTVAKWLNEATGPVPKQDIARLCQAVQTINE